MKKNGTALSVIIPVYNAESSIRKAIDSLLCQSLENIEIICVDDGSTDSTVAVIGEYVKKDPRVVLLRQRNQYAGVARNTGIDAAKGEYLFFLDADDHVLNYALEAAYLKCVQNDLDCLKFPCLTYDAGRKRFVENRMNDFSQLQPGDFNRLLELYENSPLLAICVAPWSGLFRRSFVLENGCRFNSLFCVNDRSFYTKVITQHGRFMCSPDRVIIHRVNQKESLIGKRAEHFDCQIESLRITETQLAEDAVPPAIAEMIMTREYQDLIHWYSLYSANDEQKQKMDRMIDRYLKEDRYYFGCILSRMLGALPGQVKNTGTIVRKGFHKKADKPCVSVIVPILSGEGNLNLLLSSLTNQTLEEMEFILLCTEETGRDLTVIREYAETDKRFIIVNRENAGYEQMINAGLDMAGGEYVGFLSSDDYAEKSMYESLYHEAKNHGRPDLVLADYELIRINRDGSLVRRFVFLSPDDYYYDRTVCPEKEKEVFFFPVSIRSGIYSRSLLDGQQIRYQETPEPSDRDNWFLFRICCRAKKARFIRNQLCQIREENAGSAFPGNNAEYSQAEGYRQVRGWLESDPSMKNAFEKIMYDRQYLSMLRTLGKLEGERRRPYLLHMQEELKGPFEKELFDRQYLSPPDRERLKEIVDNAEAYSGRVGISVIIPVYNAEETIGDCLQSVLSRSVVNTEVICIDCGSTDRSPELLRRAAEKDCRVRVITTENTGVGGARNEGLKHAGGEYLSFLDADVFYEEDMLDRAWNRAKTEKLDVVVFPSDNYDADRRTYSKARGCREELLPKGRPFAGGDVKRDVFRLFGRRVWDKLFRTEYIRNAGLSFVPLQSCNDLSFVLPAVANAGRIDYMDCIPLAHRRIHAGTAAAGTEVAWDCFYHALTELRNNLKRLGIFSRFERDYVNFALYFSFRQMTRMKVEGYEKIYPKLAGEWLGEFGVTGKPRAYFYHPEEYDMMIKMKDLSPGDFLLEMNQRLQRDNASPAAQTAFPGMDAILNSASFRIGRMVTAIPRKARTAYKMLKSQGVQRMLRYGRKKGSSLLERSRDRTAN